MAANGKERFCWNCGDSMGFIENRHHDSRDTCGKRECQREEQAIYREEREQAHREVDERFDGGW